MFWAVSVPIIRRLFTVHSAFVYMSYRREDSFEQDQDGPAVLSWSCSKAVFKPIWQIAVPSVQWINAWQWAEELPETCKVSCQSNFGKLVHLVGFIIKKFVTMHGHMNVMHYHLFQMIFIMCCRIPARLTLMQIWDIYSARKANLFLSKSMKK
jgi:hypothetical protein